MNVKNILIYFITKYKERFGVDYPVNWSKHCGIIGKLKKLYGDENLLRMVDKYLTSSNKFIKDTGYKIELLSSEIPKYLCESNLGQYHQDYNKLKGG